MTSRVKEFQRMCDNINENGGLNLGEWRTALLVQIAQNLAIIADVMTADRKTAPQTEMDRPQGEWKHLEGDEWVCSNCGYVVSTGGSWEHPLERGKDFCEHCGARM